MGNTVAVLIIILLAIFVGSLREWEMPTKGGEDD